MDIGSSLAIFLTLSMILLGLFCFITKYLHNKMKRSLQDKTEAHFIQDELYNTSQQDHDYDRTNQKMKHGQNRNRSGSKINLEMEDDDSYKSRLKGNDDQIYKPNSLRIKLSTSALQLDGKQQTTRSLTSQKSFRPQKMNTSRVNNDPIKASQDLIKHTYISKLIKYDFTGLAIMDITLKVIRKTIEGEIKENKKINFHAFITTDQMFKAQLQNAGFQQGCYGCFKEESTIEVMNNREETVHKIDEMKISQSKKEITEYQYENNKKQIKLQCSLE